ncbi:Alcohol dehydrogenase GroES domain protein OS=Tsukamurella paurometabola (strain ATCC 8368 / DSM/ CCUG 35730 / CIP 100753 / JCM 10117 / KCTC 9821 / NBRC 16120 / NCIMB 702349 / NCTC 13040) OX=521096 GN=Tpau_3947 PE=3 SV=1 [Tsukamurella paurometabola]|uniref:Alcohol dehydrogenase GroES domain protein n=1 Tax=Tsukamurella paurometabola (strain ATCC 8368 / DSM 20162 / CCUG 35730 / CIP 100753 / JCM 10117 / KCTC 9821 / NBRC 16120 / NCIMB 702349 / NCTC 13040) TaxID=521096 RepID=D5UMP5_TSUPD|nr:alcohol dehydrogenase catalytic domain-containing protein [Tsukamurella paurometabola]ADG80519.1 Alcohol dehydrogenase GroES domain protein [Tsukamurella paurometabola DSM 20162]SUP39946.1 S-(hydroxymethyl)mycothiol dehydrogenase [Tsukamurella paurometabola]
MRIVGAVLEESGRPRPYARSRPITVGELELDDPGPTELLVRIEAAGVCHSDLSVVEGNRPRPTPMLLGHEAAGIVVAAGDEVGDISPGQRVVMCFLPRCERCPDCAAGGRLPCAEGTAANSAGTLLRGARLSRSGRTVRHHLGVSGFATHAVVDRASVVPVDADVPPAVAAVLGCAVLTGGGAVLTVADPAPTDSVMVVGLGGVGMAAVLTARALGVERVVAVDTAEDKLDRARELGATETYTPARLTDAGITARYVIECAGSARAFETAFAATESGGTTITVGLPAPAARAEISPLTVTAEARTIIGSYVGSSVPARDIPRYVDLWRAGRLPVEKLISSTIRLDRINEAMDLLADGRAVRQVILFDHDDER